jgi:transcriptional regulator with XRE-family HTH domain
MNFASRIKELRLKYSLSQKVLSDLLGISPRAYRFYETDEHEPEIKNLITLANYFAVSLDYLTGRDDDPRYKNYLLKAENALLEDMPTPFIKIFEYAKSKGLREEKITPEENWYLIRWFEEWKQNTHSYIDYCTKLAEYEKSEDEKYIKKQMEDASPFKPIVPRTIGFWDILKRYLHVKKPKLDWYISKTGGDLRRDDVLTRNLQRLIGVDIGINGNVYCTPIPNHLSNYLYPITESDINNLTEAYIKEIGG